VSTGGSNSPNGPTPGRTGRRTGSSPNPDRHPDGTDNLRRSWGRIRAAAGLSGTRFHDTRYTCVSLLLHLGVAPDMVREIVGHSDIEVTMTIYAHTSLDEKRRALDKLGDALA
jgi:integrase